MRTRSAGVGLAVALLATLGTGAQAQGDSVVGSGKPTVLETFLTVDARSGPSGESPSGFGETQFSGGQVPVTCLAVAGNRAVLGLDLGADTIFILIVDNGFTGDVFAASISEADPAVCPAPSGFTSTLGPSGLDFGDYIVVDDPPLPTAKGQCQDGAWRAFGTTFKNQGRCLAFVQRGSKP